MHLDLPEINLDDAQRLWTEEPDEFTREVTMGMSGMNEGMGNGLVRINNFLHGTHTGRYYLIGADSAVGKTTLGDFMYLLNLWLHCRKVGRKFYGIYFSFEISKREKIARWISYFIFLTSGKEIPSDYFMGRIPGILLNDTDLELVKRARVLVIEMLKDMEIIEGGIHPTGALNVILDHYEKHGKILRGPSRDLKKKGPIIGYEPNDPRAVHTIYCDHLALGHEEKGTIGTKAMMDRFSQYFVYIRNYFRAIIVVYQQFTTEMTSVHRMQKRNEAILTPQRLDFGDSKYTFRDADIVFGLIAPIKFDLELYHGYDVKALGANLLMNFIMKNRYVGIADRMIPLFMNPITGTFKELPTEPQNLLAMTPYYEQSVKLEQLCLSYSPKVL